jgi:hypothetical protein
MQRAVYNKEVIAQWGALMRDHNRTYGRYTIASGVVAAFGLIAAFLFSPIFFIAFLLGFAGVILLAHAGTSRFKCPNCGVRPGSLRSSPVTAEICPHCHFWLKSPYASDQQRSA